jgi:single-strand DNA-binding protein
VINTCVLVGRIANDPEMRYTPSGMAVVNFRIAVDRQKRDESGEKQADFLDVVAFGKTGEFVAQYLDKGSMVGVEGRIQSRTWTTQEGQKRYSVEIVGNSVQALESRQESERRRAARGTAAPSGAPAGAPGGAPAAGQPAPAADDYGPIGDDEDPFGDQ